MRWSFRIGSIFGIPLRVHVTFVLVLLLIAISGVLATQSPQGLVSALVIASLFVCVVLHELGHSLVAIRYGVKIEAITLLPIGGVSQMRDIPESPKAEIAISIVGPLVSVGVGGLLLLAIRAGPYTWGQLQNAQRLGLSFREFVRLLGTVNLVLAGFNLLPAFPLDGGRILRGLIGVWVPYARATHIAVFVGQGFAILIGFYGFYRFNLILMLIALFIYIGAGSEERSVQLRSVLRGVPVGEVMSTRFQTLSRTDTLAKSLELMYHGCQDDFPVIADEALVGVLARSKILSRIHERGPETRVQEVMDTNLASVEPDVSLDEAYRRMMESGSTALPVLEHGVLVGMLGLDNISRYFMVQSALKDWRRHRGEADRTTGRV